MKNVEVIRNFVRMKSKKKALAAELRALEQDIKASEEIILEGFIEDGVSKITVDDIPVFMKSQIFVSPVRQGDDGPDEAYSRTCEILRKVGLGDLVRDRFNANTLSAYVREELAEGRQLPDALKEALNITERHSVGVSGA